MNTRPPSLHLARHVKVLVARRTFDSMDPLCWNAVQKRWGRLENRLGLKIQIICGFAEALRS